MKNALLTFALYAIRILAIVAGAIVLWGLCVVVLSGCGGPPFSSAGFFDPVEGGVPPLAVTPSPEASPPVTTPDAGIWADVDDAGNQTPETSPPLTKPDAGDAGPALCCTWHNDAGSGSVACVQNSWACDRPRSIDYCDTADPSVLPCPIGYPCKNEGAAVPGWPFFDLGIVTACP
jgi:hypothetical protein